MESLPFYYFSHIGIIQKKNPLCNMMIIVRINLLTYFKKYT